MEYRQGRLGRIFVLKFSHKEDVKKSLEGFLKKEGLKTAVFVFLGAFGEGRLVTGPKKAVVPPEPNYAAFKDGWEVLGLGTVFPGNGPQVHMHASMGKKRKTLTGCVRQGVGIFMVIEAVVFELKGVKAAKELDPKTGLNLLKFL
ncbi:MAG: PPC domain-containing DNA-binding protein [Candidatus Omnitrophota bacterium]